MRVRRAASKVLVMVLALVMLLAWPGGVFPPQQASAAAGSELLPNGGFEQETGGLPDHWTKITQGAYYFMESTNVYAGAKALKMDDPSFSTGVGMRSDPVLVVPGDRYEASVFVKNDSGKATLYLEYWNANDERIATKTLKNQTTGSWNELKVEEDAPLAAKYATLLMYSDSTNVGVAYFDKASLRNISQLDELLPNSSFEDVDSGLPEQWTAITPGYHYIAAADKFVDGSYSLKMTDTLSNQGVGMRSAHVSVVEGNEIASSVMVYDESGHTSMYLEFWDADDTRIAYKAVTNVTTATWTKLALTDVAPVDTVSATILLYSSLSNVGVSYFDAASIRHTTASPQLFPNSGFESVTANKPTGWTPLSSAITIESSTERVLAGTHSVKFIDASTTAASGLRSAKVPIIANETYSASVQIYNNTGNSETLYLEFWDAANTRILYKYKTITAVEAWTNATIEGIAPADAVSASILLYSTAANVGTGYFDQASLHRLPNLHFTLEVPDHPRLFFTNAELTGLRALAGSSAQAATGETAQELWQTVLTSADEYMQETEFEVLYYNQYPVVYPLPPVQPGPMDPPPGYSGSTYPYWTAMASAIQRRLETLSLAYAITQDTDYADKAKSYLLSLTNWSKWTDTTYACGGGHSCLDTAHLTLGVSTAYDILYSLLSTGERTEVEEALETLGLEPLRISINNVDNNADALRAAALGSGGSVLLGKSANADKFLTRAIRFYEWYLDFRMTSGQTEGFNYTNYSLENMIRGIDNITRVTGEQTLIHHPFFDNFVVRWSNYFLSPGGGGMPTISDSGANTYSYGFFHNTMSIIANWLEDPYAVWYLTKADVAGSAFDRFIYFTPAAEASAPTDWPTSEVFDEVGWAALRSGWEEDDVLMTLIGNNTTIDHSHFDQNSFTLSTNKIWIARDPGYKDVSAGPKQDFTLKYGHSTIQVDGNGQSVRGNGQLQTGILSPHVDYVTGSAPGAYGGALSQFDRHVVRVNDYYVMLDDLDASASHDYDYVLYAGPAKDVRIDGTLAVSGAWTNGNKFSYRHSGTQLTAYTLAPSALPISYDQHTGAENYGYVFKVRSSAPATDYQILTVLKAEASAPPEGVLESWDLLDAVSGSSGDELDVVGSATAKTFLLKADDVGDYVEFSVDVDSTDTYNLSGYVLESSVYGQFNVYIDSQQIGSTYDAYNPLNVSVPLFSFGDVPLTAGTHTIRVEVVGKDPSAGQYWVGIDELRLLPASNTEVATDSALVAMQLSAAGVLGAEVSCNPSCSEKDVILFRTGSSAYAVANVASDAAQAVVSRNASGAPTAFAITDGTSLADNGQTLLQSSVNFDASLAYSDATGLMKGIVQLDASAAVTFHVPASPASVKVNGVPTSSYTYNSGAKTLTISLSAGASEIEVQM